VGLRAWTLQPPVPAPSLSLDKSRPPLDLAVPEHRQHGHNDQKSDERKDRPAASSQSFSQLTCVSEVKARQLVDGLRSRRDAAADAMRDMPLSGDDRKYYAVDS
jgi:hypothetical protein